MSKPDWLEPLEQTGHFFMGFGARLVFLDYLLWRREAVKQWPPGKPFMIANLEAFHEQTRKAFKGEPVDRVVDEMVTQLDRVEDMMTDMRWYTIGGTCADVVRAAGVLFWAFA